MFDVAWSEMLVVGAVALVVVGPKDLPRVMREVGRWVSRARVMAGQFRNGFDQMIQEAELDELRRGAGQPIRPPEPPPSAPPPEPASVSQPAVAEAAPEPQDKPKAKPRKKAAQPVETTP